MERSDHKSPSPSPEQLEEMTRALKAMIGDISDDHCRRQCGEAIRRGFDALFRIKQQSPELAQLAQAAAYNMMLVSQYLAADQRERHLQPERSEARDARPTDGYRNTARQLAQSIAFKHWKEDKAEEISLASMSLYVWGKMIEMHYVEFLPDDYQELQHWIAGVAPEYAQRQLRCVSRPAATPLSDNDNRPVQQQTLPAYPPPQINHRTG